MQRRNFLTAAVSALIVRAQENLPRVVGRWYTVVRSRGGIGAMMEFFAGGTVNYSPGAILECTYSVEGQKLIIKFVDPVAGPQPDQVLLLTALSQEKMTTQAAESGTPMPEEWTRVGSPEDRERPLLGSWTAPRDTGGLQLSSNWRFRANGSAVFMVPFSHTIGQYRVAKSIMRLNVARAVSFEGKISWEGDILVLPGTHGPTKLRRF